MTRIEALEAVEAKHFAALVRTAELEAHIEVMEAALREIVEISPILSEIERIARAALARCAKCGRETNSEEALVNGEIWCHPCADREDK